MAAAIYKVSTDRHLLLKDGPERVTEAMHEAKLPHNAIDHTDERPMLAELFKRDDRWVVQFINVAVAVICLRCEKKKQAAKIAMEYDNKK